MHCYAILSLNVMCGGYRDALCRGDRQSVPRMPAVNSKQKDTNNFVCSDTK